MKRFIDIILSVIGLIIICPLLIIIMIVSLLIQGFPILFLHERLGKEGKLFTLIKLRTMTKGPSISAENDIIRITNWGRFLRRTSIDELPVLFNVIKGDMSLVGPRPLPGKYLLRFNEYQRKRLKVKPGITGLAQINGRNLLSWEERFDFDIKYVNNMSIILDLGIIINTLLLVLKGVGVSSKEQEIMPEFMGSLKSKKIQK
jgi:undecaprenyl phosphate N,N'-diacetylbacillosamine 1-phosphate transferase